MWIVVINQTTMVGPFATLNDAKRYAAKLTIADYYYVQLKDPNN